MTQTKLQAQLDIQEEARKQAQLQVQLTVVASGSAASSSTSSSASVSATSPPVSPKNDRNSLGMVVSENQGLSNSEAAAKIETLEKTVRSLRKILETEIIQHQQDDQLLAKANDVIEDLRNNFQVKQAQVAEYEAKIFSLEQDINHQLLFCAELEVTLTNEVRKSRQLQDEVIGLTKQLEKERLSNADLKREVQGLLERALLNVQSNEKEKDYLNQIMGLKVICEKQIQDNNELEEKIRQLELLQQELKIEIERLQLESTNQKRIIDQTFSAASTNNFMNNNNNTTAAPSLPAVASNPSHAQHPSLNETGPLFITPHDLSMHPNDSMIQIPAAASGTAQPVSGTSNSNASLAPILVSTSADDSVSLDTHISDIMIHQDHSHIHDQSQIEDQQQQTTDPTSTHLTNSLHSNGTNPGTTGHSSSTLDNAEIEAILQAASLAASDAAALTQAQIADEQSKENEHEYDSAITGTPNQHTAAINRPPQQQTTSLQYPSSIPAQTRHLPAPSSSSASQTPNSRQSYGHTSRIPAINSSAANGTTSTASSSVFSYSSTDQLHSQRTPNTSLSTSNTPTHHASPAAIPSQTVAPTTPARKVSGGGSGIPKLSGGSGIPTPSSSHVLHHHGSSNRLSNNHHNATSAHHPTNVPHHRRNSSGGSTTSHDKSENTNLNHSNGSLSHRSSHGKSAR